MWYLSSRGWTMKKMYREKAASSWSSPGMFLLCLSWRQINCRALSRSIELGTLLSLDPPKVIISPCQEWSTSPCSVFPRGWTQSSRRILPDWKRKWGQKSFQPNFHFKVKHIRRKMLSHTSSIGSSCVDLSQVGLTVLHEPTHTNSIKNFHFQYATFKVFLM